MPNHWESSARPLFVKTIFVNGSRHAILSQKDPLLNPKKQTRPRSSFSMGSTLSISSSESEDNNSETRVKISGPENTQTHHAKDISLQLQDCLVKLRLPPRIRKTKSNDYNESSLDDEDKEKEDEKLTKQKRKKSSRGRSKSSKKKSCTYYYEENYPENQLQEASNSGQCCYVYNFENSKGKKKYCFVKITSKPSHLILNCSCDKDRGESHEFCGSKDSSNKNNMVISATFHNLVMTSVKNENPSHNPSDYFLSIKETDSCDLYWNNYLKRSYYNSLSERVIQWLDLANRKKKQESCDTRLEEVSPNSIERIFAGRTFLDENNKTINKINDNILVRKEKEKHLISVSNDKDVDSEVKVEDNVLTALSIDCGNESAEEVISGRKSSRREKQQIARDKNFEGEQNSPMSSIPFKFNSNSAMSSYLKESIISQLCATTKSSTHDINTNSDDFNQTQNKRKTSKEKCATLLEEKNENLKIKTVKCWERGVSQRGEKVELTRCEGFSESVCRLDQGSEWQSAAKSKTQNLALELEKNQKSINNPNITRSRPGSLTSLSPQQHNKMSWLLNGKSEKELGKPQLHIFIPSLPTRDPNDDTLSECDSILGEVS